MSRIDDRLIDAMPSPGDMHADQRAAAVVRVKHRLDDIADWFAQLIDLDPATATGSTRVKVTTSKEPPSPLKLDLLDLRRRLRPADPRAVAEPEWWEDQIGYKAVAGDLLVWAADWASERDEWTPRPTVAALTSWLSQDVRLEWAYDRDHHENSNPTQTSAWDEMAATVERVARDLYATVTPKRPRAVPVSAPCPDGDCPGPLRRHEDGWVECSADGCTHALSEREYRDWAVATIHRVANGGWGITAREIQIRTGWPAGAVRRYVIEYGLTKTGPEQRPTLYSREQFEQARPKIEAKRQARAEREARAA